MSSSAEHKPLLPLLFLAMGIAALGGGVLLLLAGKDYYALSDLARPFHPEHVILRPSGRVGLFLGIAGSALMLLNLTYLARKRLLGIRWLGPLRTWMAFHVFSGLVGSGMIVLHSAFTPHSALALVAFLAMLVAATTGMVGRYIYARIPRSVEGHELEFDEIRRRLTRHLARLDALGIEISALLDRAPQAPAARSRGLLSTLAVIARGDPAARRDLKVVKAAVRRSSALRPHRREILRLSRSLLAERAWLSRYGELRALMGSWRFLHRWLAIVMLLLVVFHVYLALRYGDLRVFGGGP